MRLSEIDLNLLVVFDAVSREQNLTRAAQKLGLSQPAISHALARLRELFQDSLFTRSGRVMVPTPFTRSILTPVREALTTLEHGLFPNRSFDPKLDTRRFMVGLPDALESAWLPMLVEHFHKRAPQLSLVSTRVARTALETELSTGEIDLAIEIQLPVNATIRQQKVAEDRLVVVARKGHPLAKKLTLERYLDATHLLVSSRRKGPGIEDMALRQAGHRRRVALRCQNYHAACLVVRSTDLLLTMPERLARSLTEGHDNLVVPFPLGTPALAMHMYWHAASDNDAANQWLRDEVLRLAGKV